jgi:hypothetical protein
MVKSMRDKCWMKVAAVGMACAVVAGLASCRNPHPKAEAKLAAELSPLVYPGEAPLGADLDVLVIRDGAKLKLANREGQSFDDVQVWLNQQWVAKVGRLSIGSDNKFDLRHFVNRYGEQYPTAGFLQPERSLRLVLAELYDPETNQRHRLNVQLKGEVTTGLVP